MCMSIHTSTTSRTHQKDARGGWCGSIGRPRGQKHAPHVNSSPPARGLGLVSAPLPKRCIVYACMFMCESDATVAMCGLGRRRVLSSATELGHSVDGPVWCSQDMCWVAWKARESRRRSHALHSCSDAVSCAEYNLMLQTLISS